MKQVTPELYRSSRPGYSSCDVPLDIVQEWIEEVKGHGIKTIICLLEEKLKCYGYSPGLLAVYRQNGFEVIHRPVKDHQKPPIDDEMLRVIFSDYYTSQKPVLIHCSAGCDRTGAAVCHIRNTDDSDFDRIVQFMSDNACRRGEEHFRQVTRLSLSLYDQLEKTRRLPPRYRTALWAAAMLHDVGTASDDDMDHAWISFEMIMKEGIEIPQLVTCQEIATVAGLHRSKGETESDPVGIVYQKIRDLYPDGIPCELLKLAAILRVADGLDRGLNQTIERVRISGNELIVEPFDEYNVCSAKKKIGLFKSLFDIR